MKPKVDDKRCFASQSVCKAIKACPTEAISYIEVADPILDKNLVCNCAPAEEDGSARGCGCDCDCGNDLYSCGGTPYGRIIIDYDRRNISSSVQRSRLLSVLASHALISSWVMFSVSFHKK